MMVLVFDTDFLMKVTNEPLPAFRRMLDEFDCELVTLPSVKRELKGLLSSRINKTSRYARNALHAIDANIVRVDDIDGRSSSPEADVDLIDYVSNLAGDSFVVSLDGALLSELERKHIPYVTLRKDRPFKRDFGRATYLTTKKRQN